MITLPRSQWEYGYRYVTLQVWGRGHQGSPPGMDTEPNPEGSVSARQREQIGKTRLLVLAEASDKELLTPLDLYSDKHSK